MKPIGSPATIKRLQLACVFTMATLASTSWGANSISVPTPPLTAYAAVEVFFSTGTTTDQAIAASILSAKRRVGLVGDHFTSAQIGTYRRGMVFDQPELSEASAE